MVENYLNVLEDSLVKKIAVLNRIQEYSVREQELFMTESVDFTLFDDFVAEKEGLIQEVTKLDEGFETLYAALAENLKENKENYQAQIKRLQGLITQVTEMSITIQAQETRNKKLVETYFSAQKSGIGSSRKSSKAAYDYYKNMNGSSIVSPQFMDKKK